jgi:hypothetical protein
MRFLRPTISFYIISTTFFVRYGVQEVFEAEDLLELRNIPKVTKCLAQLSKLVRNNNISLLFSKI